ncbi:MAG: MFS transporter [Chloroflexota bacterium]
MNARRTYLFITFSTALFFTMWSMYTGVYRVAAGLSPLQLVLLGTMLEAAVFFAEVPTGIVADIYSRKWSIIIGLIIISCGFMLEGALPWVVTIFVAQAIWGIGYTFTSGAQDAWLAGEIGEAELGSTMLRGSQFGRIGSLVGMGVAALIALSSSVNFALIAGGAGYLILALVLAFQMPETGFQPADQADRSTWGQMRHTFWQGWGIVKSTPILLLMFAVTIFAGLGSEGIDRFWEAHLLLNFEFPQILANNPALLNQFSGDNFSDFGPNITLWFFIINLTASLLSLGVTEIVRRRVAVNEDAAALRYLIVGNTIIIGAILVFGFTFSFPAAIAAWFVLGSFRGTIGPIVGALLNRHIRQDVRATVLSMWGQADAIGQMVSGPLMGFIVTIGPLRWAFAAVAILLAPIVLIYRRILKRHT